MVSISQKKIKANDQAWYHSLRFHHIRNKISKIIRFLFSEVLSLKILYKQEHFSLVSWSLLLFELFLNIFIINRIKYTEIDWSTYMQQVECFLNKTLDYGSITGDTGPIVYPAGHLYIYTILYYLTGRGQNIYLAQHLFMFVYLSNLAIVFYIYKRYSQVPPYVLIFMCCASYRLHSIYVLRLFNDTLSVFFLHLSLAFFANKKWTFGSIFFSLAVSIKMNILLYAPSLFLIYNENLSKVNVLKNLVLCASIQVFLGAPFLLSHPKSYIKSSFDLGRVFMHKWTVNYRFLPESVFINPLFHLILLFLHILVLLIVFRKRWLKLIYSFFVTDQSSSFQSNGKNILLTMFIGNFIGIVFARSLHYQFYVWYYHSLPFILWNVTHYKTSNKLFILGLIELVWNIYPSTVWSSGVLHVLHFSILCCFIGNGMLTSYHNREKQSYDKIK